MKIKGYTAHPFVSNYPFRCWMFSAAAPAIPKTKEAIGRASEFGLTTAEITEINIHNLVEYSNFPKLKVLASKYKQRDIARVRDFCRICRDNKLDPYIFVFELMKFKEIGEIYSEALNPTMPLMWDIIAQRLGETFELFPDLAGIEVYLDEGPCLNLIALSEYRVNGILRNMPAPEVVARFIVTYLTVCRKYKKKFILCTFNNRAYRLRSIQAGLKLVPPSPDFYVNQWMVPGDFGEYLAHNPCIGDIGGHPEIITFDFNGELWGASYVPFCYLDYLKERWTDALRRSNNIIGYNGWLDVNSRHFTSTGSKRLFILNTANEINGFALSRLAQEPDLKTETIWNEWTAKCSDSPEATGMVKSALKRTQVIGEKAWMLKGFWFMEWPKSGIPGIRFAIMSPYRESTAEWDESLRPIEDAIFFPTEEFLHEIINDRKEALALSQKSFDEIKEIKEQLLPPWDNELPDSLERLVVFCRVSLHFTELFFRWKLWWLKRPGGSTDKIDHGIQVLSDLADDIETKFGPDSRPSNPERIRLFIRQLKEMMVFGQGPIPDWSGVFLTPLAKRYVASILEILGLLAEAKAGGTCNAAQEKQNLKDVERLKCQLMELGNLT